MIYWYLVALFASIIVILIIPFLPPGITLVATAIATIGFIVLILHLNKKNDELDKTFERDYNEHFDKFE